MRISRKDVVAAANVSQALVSRCGKSLPVGDSVLVDQEEVINQAVEPLQKCGHQVIAPLASIDLP